MFGSIITAMVTPFNITMNIDLRAVEGLVKHLESTGTNTLLLAGTTGEGPTLTEDEKMILLNEVCKFKSKETKIIMNVGTNNTKETLENAKRWSNNPDVDGLMVVAPYYNKPSQAGLFKHFEMVNNEVNKPIMVYHIPSRTGVTMTAETMLKIAGLSNVKLLKDSEGDLNKLKMVTEETKDMWDIYCGDDHSLLNYLKLGAKGVVSVASHIVGNEVMGIIEAYDNKALETASIIQDYVSEVAEQLFPSFAPNPVTVKYILAKMGLIQEDVRLPLLELNEWEKTEIKLDIESFSKNEQKAILT